MSRTPIARPARKAAPRPRRASPLIVAGRLLAVPLLAWALGLIWFSLALPGPAPLSMKSDGVVVLTGGAGRFRRGLEVVEARAARRMLISGVGRTTTKKQLAAAYGISKKRLGRTDLGYEAVDTRSNAQETARWVERHHFTSIRLVTNAAHMRRAQLELARVLSPEVTVLPDAVPSEPKAPGVAFEYTKWLLRRAALAAGAA